jgi:hypothetical protein
MRKILKFFYRPKGSFKITKQGFKRAIFWSRLQDHPNSKKLTLFNYLYSKNLDGWENLHNINQYKQDTFNY